MSELAELDATRRGYDLVAGHYAAELANELTGKPLDRALLDMIVELGTGGTSIDISCGS